MANLTLKIEHIATGLSVDIQKFFFTEFSDSIDTKYNSTHTYGRMDPIVSYQGSSRKISVGMKLTPGAVKDGSPTDVQCLNWITKLQKMQYPVYQRGENALTIQRPPLVRVLFANLIRDGSGGALICAMNGFAFTPKTGFTPEDSPFVRFGGEVPGEEAMKFGEGTTVSFKNYNLKFDFTVLHQQPVGFSDHADVQSITDPTFKGAGSMKFLGGYAFGPTILTKAATGAEVLATSALGLNTPHGGAAADTADGVATGGHGRGARNPSR